MTALLTVSTFKVFQAGSADTNSNATACACRESKSSCVLASQTWASSLGADLRQCSTASFNSDRPWYKPACDTGGVK